MAIVLPRPLADLADLLKIETAHWNVFRQDEFSSIGNGDFLSHDLGPQLWEADVSSPQMYHADARRIKARLNALDGSNNAFYLFSPIAKYPAFDPLGIAYGASTPTIHTIDANRKALRITGLPSGFKLTDGDLFAVDYLSGKRALIEVSEPTTASSGGLTPLFEVRPHLRPGISTGQGANFIKPAAKVKIMPGTLRIDTTGALHSRIRFTARQTLQAG